MPRHDLQIDQKRRAEVRLLEPRLKVVDHRIAVIIGLVAVFRLLLRRLVGIDRMHAIVDERLCAIVFASAGQRCSGDQGEVCGDEPVLFERYRIDLVQQRPPGREGRSLPPDIDLHEVGQRGGKTEVATRPIGSAQAMLRPEVLQRAKDKVGRMCPVNCSDCLQILGLPGIVGIEKEDNIAGDVSDRFVKG